jgi:hypothetical protein
MANAQLSSHPATTIPAALAFQPHGSTYTPCWQVCPEKPHPVESSHTRGQDPRPNQDSMQLNVVPLLRSAPCAPHTAHQPEAACPPALNRCCLYCTYLHQPTMSTYTEGPINPLCTGIPRRDTHMDLYQLIPQPHQTNTPAANTAHCN